MEKRVEMMLISINKMSGVMIRLYLLRQHSSTRMPAGWYLEYSRDVPGD